MDETRSARFKKKFVAKLIQLHLEECGHAKSKVNNDALALITEALYVYVKEAVVRSKKRAEREDSSLVTIEHFEKILPQLMLDF